MIKEIYGIIYLIKNEINNKIYIGQTIQKGGFDARYGNDLENKTHNEYLKNSIKKYGIDKFYIDKEFDIAYSKEELDKLEDLYIKIYNTTDREFGYNRQYGGSNGKPSDETRKKMSENHADVNGENNPRYGATISIETRDKIGLANKGKLSGENNYWYGKDRSGELNPMYGKTHSEESKKMISELQKGNTNMLGKHHSKETRDKIGENKKIKVICITENKEFDSIKEASDFYDVHHGSISKCCKKKVKSAVKHPITNEKLVWMYYDDYIKQNNLQERCD